MKNLLFLIIFIVLFSTFLIYISYNDSEKSFKAKVYEITDADTIKVKNLNTENIKTIRLIGVDSPEIYSNNKAEEYFNISKEELNKCLTYFGYEGKKFVKSELKRETLNISYDKIGDTVDPYGRKLAYIYYKNKSLNQILIEEGYARVYITNFSNLEVFKTKERKARNKNLNLWSCTN